MFSTPTFLTLPRKIRLKIYIFADLVRLCPINPNNEGSRRTDRERHIKGFNPDVEMARNRYCDYRSKKFLHGRRHVNSAEYGCICPPLPIQLLTVCRTMYQEVWEVLYSQNKFKVFLNSSVQLESKAVARMTSLCIRLNMCSCIEGHTCDHPASNYTNERCTDCHPLCNRGRDSPISLMSRNGIDKIDFWVAVCKTLQNAVRPSMRLTVICDCADAVTAQKIIEPMRLLPKMAECSIRLGQSPTMEWRHLAEETVFELTDRPRASNFRFLDLPRELQREILHHTDLCSPYILECNGYIYPTEQRRGIMPFHLGDHSCCLQCNDAAEACCCNVNHAAFSSVQCTCWSFTTALFEVSREIRQEAMEIFFSKNKFLIEEQPWPFDGQPGMREGLSFFQCLPSLALKSLRWIRFNLGYNARMDVPEGSAPLAGWKKTAEFIAENFDTSQLTIELDLRYGYEYPDVYDEVETDTVRENIWKSYQNLAEVFHFKDGLKDFFVFLASPYEYPGIMGPQLRKDRERILEKRIMGEGYDSPARGKYTNRGVSFSEVAHERVYGFLPRKYDE
ncbi:hypothetical protein CPB84DRAFT_1963902 [Gymnopilus junonius]|uniref:Uncharacterized protein n=1 Tax=Gymnopilus junonius TaxID=109634 RepID=A0A9P5NK90_GYMJU|nr:hypothetical protein CPB84DRAFT_1963902 [Gymnopilus junonius]